MKTYHKIELEILTQRLCVSNEKILKNQCMNGNSGVNELNHVFLMQSKRNSEKRKKQKSFQSHKYLFYDGGLPFAQSSITGVIRHFYVA